MHESCCFQCDCTHLFSRCSDVRCILNGSTICINNFNQIEQSCVKSINAVVNAYTKTCREHMRAAITMSFYTVSPNTAEMHGVFKLYFIPHYLINLILTKLSSPLCPFLHLCMQKLQSLKSQRCNER